MNKGITSEMLKLPAKQPDLQELYHNIWQFREAAFLCMKPQRMSFGIVKGLWVPSMVLLAFACELELKYIYISETGKTIKEHALSQLFEQLSEGQKNEIKKQFNPEDEFEVNIKEFEAQ